jgi:hypothetical protein
MSLRTAASTALARSLRAARATSRLLALAAAIVLACLARPSAAAAQSPEPRPELSAYLVVLASGLNVREAPDLAARVVGAVGRGERLCAIRYEGSWAEVVTPSSSSDPGRRGFVSRGFVSETRAGREEMQEMGCPVPPPQAGSAASPAQRDQSNASTK